MPAQAEPGEIVARTAGLVFHSAFWINLHHVLYAEAWARRPAGARRLAGSMPAPLGGALTADERAAWDHAVAYYDHALADRDLLFDDQMAGIRHALLAGSSGPPLASLAAEHRAVLEAAAPVYRALWWPAHDRANRAWITGAVERVRAVSPEVPDRLARLYSTSWITAARVDVVYVASWQGAYSSFDPDLHLVISSSDPRNQGWAAAEIVFHEVSHALIEPVVHVRFTDEAHAAGKHQPVLWHAALFYLTGEVTRQALTARGVDYTPYVYANGLFEGGWSAFRRPLETLWQPYIDGRVQLTEAVHQLVGEVPSAP